MSGKKREKKPKQKGYFRIFDDDEKLRETPMTQGKAAKLGCGAGTRPVEHEVVWAKDHPATGPLMQELVDAIVYTMCEVKGPDEAAGQSIMTLRSVAQSVKENFQTAMGDPPPTSPNAAATNTALDPERMESVVQSMVQNTKHSKIMKIDQSSIDKVLNLLAQVKKEKRFMTTEEFEEIMRILEGKVELTIQGLKLMLERLVADRTLTPSDAKQLEAELLLKVVDGKIGMVDVRRAMKEFTSKKQNA